MSNLKMSKKVKRIVDNFNISEETATYLIKTDDLYLSLDELRQKYNNPDIGVLPSWLSEEDLHKIIIKSIKDIAESKNTFIEDIDDLYQDIQLFIRKKSNKLRNFAYLKTMICNYILNVLKFRKLESDLVKCSLDQPLIDDSSSNHVGLYHNGEISLGDVTKDDSVKELSICSIIADVKDDQVRQFLIAVGFLLCNIGELKNQYNDMKKNCSDDVIKNLEDIENVVLQNDRIEYKKRSCIKTKQNERKKKLTVSTIILALKMNIIEKDEFNSTRKKQERVPTTVVLEDIQRYILGHGYLQIA